MSDVKWTKEQTLAIEEKGENILVAAAAGSGKTAVLVERIINKIINEKIDIDKILVVTFTKAAASEMKAKILEAIYKKIEENPNNNHLQRQVTLLAKANICTIDSFCLEVVKNNFFEIGISPNLRIAETTEIQILKQETLEEMFDTKYEAEDEEFLKIVNMYTSYKGDEELKNILISIFDFIQSMPFPEKWLDEKIELFNIKEESFEKTPWGEILFSKAKEEIENDILILKEELKRLKYEEDTQKLVNLIEDDISKVENIYNSKTWDYIYVNIDHPGFGIFPRDKNIPDEIKEKTKAVRKLIKDNISKLKKIIIYPSDQAFSDINILYELLLKLEKLVLEFSKEFSKAKLEKNMMDFNDIEHFALKILENEDICQKYKEKYEEILIDEYQDSNLVQESILSRISRNNNFFMVGDVKQSIYKFRGARPELFLSKYEKYKLKEELTESEDLKIQLFKNFRSRENVLSLTNIIFDSIMSKALGDIDYTEEEYLNLGAEYKEAKDLKLDFDIIDLKDEEESIYKDEEKSDDDEEEKIEDIVLEAKFVSKKIKELVDTRVYSIK